MKKIKFLKAGKHDHYSRFDLFLTSENRRKAAKGTVFHRNDYSTVYSFPEDYFRENFKYEHGSGIYRTSLRHCDIPIEHINMI